MEDIKYSANIIDELKSAKAVVLTTKSIAGDFIRQDLIIEKFLITYNKLSRDFHIIAFNACNSPGYKDYFFTIDNYKHCIIDIPNYNEELIILIEPHFKNQRYLNENEIAAAKSFVRRENKRPVKILRYIENIVSIEKAENYQRARKQIELTFEKQELLVKSQIKGYQEFMQWVLKLSSASNSLMKIENIRSTSRIVFDKPNSIQTRQFGMTTVPRRVDQKEKQTIKKDLSFLLEILLDCVKYFNFLDLQPKVEKLQTIEKELPTIADYGSMNLFKDQDLVTKTMEVKEKFYQLATELMEVFYELSLHIKNNGLDFTNYHYTKEHSSSFYENYSEEQSIVKNPSQALTNGVLTYIERILGPEVKQTFSQEINISNTSNYHK